MLCAAIVLAHELLAPGDHAPLATAVLDAEDVGTALCAARNNGYEGGLGVALHTQVFT